MRGEAGHPGFSDGLTPLVCVLIIERLNNSASIQLDCRDYVDSNSYEMCKQLAYLKIQL